MFAISISLEQVGGVRHQSEQKGLSQNLRNSSLHFMYGINLNWNLSAGCSYGFVGFDFRR